MKQIEKNISNSLDIDHWTFNQVVGILKKWGKVENFTYKKGRKIMKTGFFEMLDLKEKIESDEHVYIFPDYDIVKAVSGSIYTLAPNFKPQKIDIIMEKFLEKFFLHEKTEELIPNFYVITACFSEVKKILKEILFGIPEFEELNLPNVDGDFIDLNACIQNIMCQLSNDLIIDFLWNGSVK